MIRTLKRKFIVAAMIAVDPFESEATLEGTVLTLGPQTSAVLR